MLGRPICTDTCLGIGVSSDIDQDLGTDIGDPIGTDTGSCSGSPIGAGTDSGGDPEGTGVPTATVADYPLTAPTSTVRSQLPPIDFDDKLLVFGDGSKPQSFYVEGFPEYHGIRCSNTRCAEDWVFCKLIGRA